MTQVSLLALWCFARFFLSTSCSLSYLRHWFPALNKEDVKSTEFDELPGIWLGCKDFDILQKLRIKISCRCCQVYVTVFVKKKKIKIFQEQIKPNKDVSSSCTFVPRYIQTGWSTGYPFAVCFQVYSFIPSHILAPSISEEDQLHRCSINKLYDLSEEVFCLFFLCYHIFPVLSFSMLSTKLSQVQLHLAFVYIMCSTL